MSVFNTLRDNYFDEKDCISKYLITQFNIHIDRINMLELFSEKDYNGNLNECYGSIFTGNNCMDEEKKINHYDCNNFKIIETTYAVNIYFRGMREFGENINLSGIITNTATRINNAYINYILTKLISFLKLNYKTTRFNIKNHNANTTRSNITTYKGINNITKCADEQYDYTPQIYYQVYEKEVNQEVNQEEKQTIFEYLQSTNKSINICGFSFGSIFAIYLYIILVFIFNNNKVNTYIYGGLPCIPSVMQDAIHAKNNLYFIINYDDVTSYYSSHIFMHKPIGLPKYIYILNEKLCGINKIKATHYMKNHNPEMFTFEKISNSLREIFYKDNAVKTGESHSDYFMNTHPPYIYKEIINKIAKKMIGENNPKLDGDLDLANKNLTNANKYLRDARLTGLGESYEKVAMLELNLANAVVIETKLLIDYDSVLIDAFEKGTVLIYDNVDVVHTKLIAATKARKEAETNRDNYSEIRNGKSQPVQPQPVQPQPPHPPIETQYFKAPPPPVQLRPAYQHVQPVQPVQHQLHLVQPVQLRPPYMPNQPVQPVQLRPMYMPYQLPPPYLPVQAVEPVQPQPVQPQHQYMFYPG